MSIAVAAKLDSSARRGLEPEECKYVSPRLIYQKYQIVHRGIKRFSEARTIDRYEFSSSRSIPSPHTSFEK